MDEMKSQIEEQQVDTEQEEAQSVADDELDSFFPEAGDDGADAATSGEQAEDKDEQKAEGPTEPEQSGKESEAVEQQRSQMIPRERFDQVYSQWRAEQEVSRRLMAENEQLRERTRQEEAEDDTAESGEGEEEDDEEMDKLKQQLEDFPEVLAYVNKNSDRQQQRIAQLEAQLSALTNQIAPIQQSEQDRVRNDHFNKIHREHPDAQDIIQSKEFAAWRERQPEFLKRTYDGVLQSGTADEVIGLFGAFKEQSGWGRKQRQAPAQQAQPKADPRRDATVQRNIRESQSQPPAPTGAAGERSIRVTLPESQEDYERLSDAERLELLG